MIVENVKRVIMPSLIKTFLIYACELSNRANIDRLANIDRFQGRALQCIQMIYCINHFCIWAKPAFGSSTLEIPDYNDNNGLN